MRTVDRAHDPGSEDSNRPSFHDAIAVQKLLRGSGWCAVEFLCALHQTEARAKLRVEPAGIIPHNVETAALARSFRPEGADNNMAAGFDCGRNLTNISQTLSRICQEVKYSAIVPNVVRMRRQTSLRDVGNQPGNLLRG